MISVSGTREKRVCGGGGGGGVGVPRKCVVL